MGKKHKNNNDNDKIWERPKNSDKCQSYSDAVKVIENHERLHKTNTKDKVTVTFSWQAIQKVLALTAALDDTEFLCYLRQDQSDPENKYAVGDIYVPTQVVTWGSVDMPGDPNIPPDIIGALHKHPGSEKQQFSCTDDEKLNVNHPISIVIPESGRLDYWHCSIKKTAECGCNYRTDADVAFRLLTDDIEEAVTKRVKVMKGQQPRRVSVKDDDDIQYICTYCEREFASPKARDAHEKDKHADELVERYIDYI